MVWALDNADYDAVGAVVDDDGSVGLAINQPPSASADQPGSVRGATRFRVSVSPEGVPAITLADGADRPRLRLTVLDDGAGAIEFLNADGVVVHAIVPERDS